MLHALLCLLLLLLPFADIHSNTRAVENSHSRVLLSLHALHRCHLSGKGGCICLCVHRGRQRLQQKSKLSQLTAPTTQQNVSHPSWSAGKHWILRFRSQNLLSSNNTTSLKKVPTSPRNAPDPNLMERLGRSLGRGWHEAANLV